MKMKWFNIFFLIAWSTVLLQICNSQEENSTDAVTPGGEDVEPIDQDEPSYLWKIVNNFDTKFFLERDHSGGSDGLDVSDEDDKIVPPVYADDVEEKNISELDNKAVEKQSWKGLFTSYFRIYTVYKEKELQLVYDYDINEEEATDKKYMEKADAGDAVIAATSDADLIVDDSKKAESSSDSAESVDEVFVEEAAPTSSKAWSFFGMFFRVKDFKSLLDDEVDAEKKSDIEKLEKDIDEIPAQDTKALASGDKKSEQKDEKHDAALDAEIVAVPAAASRWSFFGFKKAEVTEELAVDSHETEEVAVDSTGSRWSFFGFRRTEVTKQEVRDEEPSGDALDEKPKGSKKEMEEQMVDHDVKEVEAKKTPLGFLSGLFLADKAAEKEAGLKELAKEQEAIFGQKEKDSEEAHDVEELEEEEGEEEEEEEVVVDRWSLLRITSRMIYGEIEDRDDDDEEQEQEIGKPVTEVKHGKPWSIINFFLPAEKIGFKKATQIEETEAEFEFEDDEEEYEDEYVSSGWLIVDVVSALFNVMFSWYVSSFMCAVAVFTVANVISQSKELRNLAKHYAAETNKYKCKMKVLAIRHQDMKVWNKQLLIRLRKRKDYLEKKLQEVFEQARMMDFVSQAELRQAEADFLRINAMLSGLQSRVRHGSITNAEFMGEVRQIEQGIKTMYGHLQESKTALDMVTSKVSYNDDKNDLLQIENSSGFLDGLGDGEMYMESTGPSHRSSTEMKFMRLNGEESYDENFDYKALRSLDSDISVKSDGSVYYKSKTGENPVQANDQNFTNGQDGYEEVDFVNVWRTDEGARCRENGYSTSSPVDPPTRLQRTPKTHQLSECTNGSSSVDHINQMSDCINGSSSVDNTDQMNGSSSVDRTTPLPESKNSSSSVDDDSYNKEEENRSTTSSEGVAIVKTCYNDMLCELDRINNAINKCDDNLVELQEDYNKCRSQKSPNECPNLTGSYEAIRNCRVAENPLGIYFNGTSSSGVESSSDRRSSEYILAEQTKNLSRDNSKTSTPLVKSESSGSEEYSMARNASGEIQIIRNHFNTVARNTSGEIISNTDCEIGLRNVARKHSDELVFNDLARKASGEIGYNDMDIKHSDQELEASMQSDSDHKPMNLAKKLAAYSSVPSSLPKGQDAPICDSGKTISAKAFCNERALTDELLQHHLQREDTSIYEPVRNLHIENQPHQADLCKCASEKSGMMMDPQENYNQSSSAGSSQQQLEYRWNYFRTGNTEEHSSSVDRFFGDEPEDLVDFQAVLQINGYDESADCTLV